MTEVQGSTRCQVEGCDLFVAWIDRARSERCYYHAVARLGAELAELRGSVTSRTDELRADELERSLDELTRRRIEAPWSVLDERNWTDVGGLTPRRARPYGCTCAATNGVTDTERVKV